jgi:hypothetical protein
MPNRRFLPRAEPLEVRALLSTTVILADIDTPSAQLRSFGDLPSFGMPDIPLGNYMLPGLDFRNPGTPTPAVPGNYGGHASVVTGQYALSMILAGRTPLVEPMVAGDNTNFTSDAIGRAMITIAYQQAAHDAAHDGIRMVASLPVNPGIEGPLELQGRAMLRAENVPLSEAAGNYSSAAEAALGITGIIPAWDGPGTLIAEAAPLNGVGTGGWSVTNGLYTYSYHGYGGTPVAIGYGGLGTSGAALVGAAQLAVMEELYPGAPVNQIVASVSRQRLVGEVPTVLPLGPATDLPYVGPATPLSAIPVQTVRNHAPVKAVQHHAPVKAAQHHAPVKMVLAQKHPVPHRYH